MTNIWNVDEEKMKIYERYQIWNDSRKLFFMVVKHIIIIFTIQTKWTKIIDKIIEVLKYILSWLVIIHIFLNNFIMI